MPPNACAGLGASLVGLAVAPLMRELILTLAGFALVDAADALQAALTAAFLATLAVARPLDSMLTRPQQPTALRVALGIAADPSREVPLAHLAAEHGTSLRTLPRRFMADTGVALSEWRQTARLMAAAASLLDGVSVTSAALDSGYSGPAPSSTRSACASAKHRAPSQADPSC